MGKTTTTGKTIPNCDPRIWAALVDVSGKRKKAKSEEGQLIEHRDYLAEELRKLKRDDPKRRALAIEYWDTLEGIRGCRSAARWLADKADKIVDRGIEGKLWEDDEDEDEPEIPEAHDLFNSGDEEEPGAAATPAAKPAPAAPVGESPAAAQAKLDAPPAAPEPAPEPTPAAEPAVTPHAGYDSRLQFSVHNLTKIPGATADKLRTAGFGVLSAVGCLMHDHGRNWRGALTTKVKGATGYTLTVKELDALAEAVDDRTGPGASSTPAATSDDDALNAMAETTLSKHVSEKDEAALRDVGILTFADLARATVEEAQLPIHFDTRNRLVKHMQTTWPGVLEQMVSAAASDSAAPPPKKGRKNKNAQPA